MHHFSRSIPVAALSDAVWPEQNSKKGDTENCVCVAVIDSNEFTIKLNVLKGKLQVCFGH